MLVEKLLADTRDWPARWQGDVQDLPAGRAIVEALFPFLQQLVASDLGAATVRRHFDNAWLLGGEIVRRLSQDPPRRKPRGVDLLLDAVGEDGGPLLPAYVTEEEQRSFDATCRRLSRFLRSSDRTAKAGR